MKCLQTLVLYFGRTHKVHFNHDFVNNHVADMNWLKRDGFKSGLLDLIEYKFTKDSLLVLCPRLGEVRASKIMSDLDRFRALNLLISGEDTRTEGLVKEYVELNHSLSFRINWICNSILEGSTNIYTAGTCAFEEGFIPELVM